MFRNEILTILKQLLWRVMSAHCFFFFFCNLILFWFFKCHRKQRSWRPYRLKEIHILLGHWVYLPIPLRRSTSLVPLPSHLLPTPLLKGLFRGTTGIPHLLVTLTTSRLWHYLGPFSSHCTETSHKSRFFKLFLLASTVLLPGSFSPFSAFNPLRLYKSQFKNMLWSPIWNCWPLKPCPLS